MSVKQKLDLSPCPFCGTEILDKGNCFFHPMPNQGDCILRHYSFDRAKAKDWNRRVIKFNSIPQGDPDDFPISPLGD